MILERAGFLGCEPRCVFFPVVLFLFFFGLPVLVRPRSWRQRRAAVVSCPLWLALLCWKHHKERPTQAVRIRLWTRSTHPVLSLVPALCARGGLSVAGALKAVRGKECCRERISREKIVDGLLCFCSISGRLFLCRWKRWRRGKRGWLGKAFFRRALRLPSGKSDKQTNKQKMEVARLFLTYRARRVRRETMRRGWG